MGAKSNIRSFRFSDEVAGILEAYTGSSLNEKFENIILHCFCERNRIDAQLSNKRREYDALCQQVATKRAELMEIERLQASKKEISSALTKVTLQTMDYLERLKAVTQDSAAAAALAPGECVTTTCKVD